MLCAGLLVTGCQNSATTPQAGIPGQQAKVSPGTMSQQTSPSQQPSAGVVHNVVGAKKRVADMEDLSNLVLAYNLYFTENGRGPASAQDIKDALPNKTVQALESGQLYVVNWTLTNLSSNSIIAYAKDPDVYGTRLVAKGDRSVTRMSKEEFEQAKAGR